MCFFWEVPRIEELQDSNSSPRRSPRREEVGRRTLRDYGGFLPSFFYRDRFQSFLENPAFHLYEVKVESRFSRNGPRESGKEKGPGQPKRMLRIYLPTTRSSVPDSRHLIPRKSEKSTESRKGVAVVFLSWCFPLALGPAPWFPWHPKAWRPCPSASRCKPWSWSGAPVQAHEGRGDKSSIPWEPRAPMAPP